MDQTIQDIARAGRFVSCSTLLVDFWQRELMRAVANGNKESARYIAKMIKQERKQK